MLNLFKESVDKFADRNAFCINNSFYTYKDFAQIVSNIRSFLDSNSESIGKNIGFLFYDDIETYATVLGILLAGKCFVPINPENPLDRNISIINQSGVNVILSSRSNDDIKRHSDNKGISFINTNPLTPTEINLSINEVDKNETAYILFTSGSTGVPKGVSLSRENLFSFIDAFFKLGYKINEKDRFLQMFDLAFDLSIMSYLIPLLMGACVYTVPSNVIKYVSIINLLIEHEITFALMVPSILAFSRPYFNEIKLPKMNYSLFCGEALYADMIKEWSKCVPNALIQNVYGPTEATIFCLTYTIPQDFSEIKSYNSVVCIGKPMNRTDIIVVDDNNMPVNEGDKGELCLAGSQLTPGYLNNPQKNKDAFFNFSINGEVKKFYKTGDLAFIDADGDVMYCGRTDYQIKVQGCRIELSEIEHHVRKCIKHNNAVAVPVEKSSGIFRIYLFVENYIGNVDEISAYLKTKVPQMMVPSKIISIPKFPLNSNGKIDRKELKRIGEEGLHKKN